MTQSVFKKLQIQPARRLSHVRCWKKVIYVGKSKDLKNGFPAISVATFASRKTEALVAQIQQIDVTVAYTETEALLLEQQLHQTLSAALQRFATR